MIELNDLIFKSGAHGTREAGVCVMEAAAWLAGEPHSDAPKCVCPTLRRLATRLNDARWSSDAVRTAALRPWLPRLMGTGATSTPEIRQRRRFALADVAVREISPESLDRRGYKDHAAKLRACDPIVDIASARRARSIAAYAAAYAAAAYAAAAAAAYAYDAAAYAAAAADAAYAAAAAAAAADAADAARDATLKRWTDRLFEAALTAGAGENDR